MPRILCAALAIACLTSVFLLLPLPISRGSSPYFFGRQSLVSPPLTSALEELHYALETMQDFYFQLWLGTWPSCIDWTAAVIGTHVSATLYSLTRSLDYSLPPDAQQPASVTAEGQRIENEINKYFSQAVTYYFGEDAFSIRNQAYDDMLWVVLGWLENIRFINLHTDAHYPTQGSHLWYGQQFTGAFAHRARVFYDLASKGWDTTDCGGGMIWNPRLIPYKNAITNELFISASISMYLDFPGDKNASPYSVKAEQKLGLGNEPDVAAEMVKAHDPVFLQAAVRAYDWLVNSNMTNEKGLYIDGFHVSHRDGKTRDGICDARNEMVYTYNQGVILSGLRGLWEGTGKTQYLEDGHKLVRNVIAATGFSSAPNTPKTGIWHGLGRDGILEDHCDALGICSQDGQNFKGIFFHHLTLFCEPLPQTPRVPGLTFWANPQLASLHKQSCKEYATWVTHNAVAAMSTRDEKGRFGMWWGDANTTRLEKRLPAGAEDYRNRGLGDPKKWGRGWSPVLEPPKDLPGLEMLTEQEARDGAAVDGAFDPRPIGGQKPLTAGLDAMLVGVQDSNDRGRGRTVETQGTGVAVVRAMWEFVAEHIR
jgi:hypothetical protein